MIPDKLIMFSCQFCGKTSTRKYNLLRHQKYHCNKNAQNNEFDPNLFFKVINNATTSGCVYNIKVRQNDNTFQATYKFRGVLL